MSSDKKIDAESGSACSNSLNVFCVPSSNVAIKKSAYREFLPLATVTNEGPYVFRVHSDSNWFDCSKNYFYIEAYIQKMVSGTWVNLEDTDKVSVSNNFAQSFIRNLKMELNGVEIYDSNNLSAYRSYFTTILSYSNDVKSHQLAAGGFYPDNSKPQNSDANTGLMTRAKYFARSKVAHFMCRLDYDLANQPLYLLNNTELVFTIHRSSDRFLIVVPQSNPATANATEYRIVVQSVKLYMKTLEVMPSINLAVLQKLLTTPAKYSMRRIEMRSTFLTKGRNELIHNVFTNVIPRRIVLGLVDSKAYNGDFTLSPYNFEHFKIRSASIEANGIIYPLAPYNLDFENNAYVRAFNDLYDNLGLIGTNKSCSISYDAYKNYGYTMFAFQMTSDLNDSNGFELIKNGTTIIKLFFNNPIPNDGAELIVLAEFDSVLTITNNRVVISDSSV